VYALGFGLPALLILDFRFAIVRPFVISFRFRSIFVIHAACAFFIEKGGRETRLSRLRSRSSSLPSENALFIDLPVCVVG
jgi:hypothetical protein